MADDAISSHPSKIRDLKEAKTFTSSKKELSVSTNEGNRFRRR
jgi:hypothetical protein